MEGNYLGNGVELANADFANPTICCKPCCHVGYAGKKG